MSYWFRNDNRLPQVRLAAASYVIVGMIGLLLLGFWKLQVIDSDKYLQMAERNRVRSIPIIAPRGRMLDRDGRVLVDNYPSFSVLLLRDDPVEVDKNLPAIADGLGLSLDDLKDQLEQHQEPAEISAHRDQAGSDPGGRGVYRIAPRGHSLAGNADGASAAVSARRVHGARKRVRGRSERTTDGERATASCAPATWRGRAGWSDSTTIC